MRQRVILLFLVLAGAKIFAATTSDYPVTPVPFTDVRITGGLLQARQATNALVTAPFALAQCESSLRLKNFDLAAETMRRRAAGETSFQNKPVTVFPFDDSDVFKAIEGASFCLSVQPNPAMQAQIAGFIKRIAAAQEPDGYLYSWRTMHPDSPAHDWIHKERWLNDPKSSHELYNLGHLYEAGVAHFAATGSRELLDIALKSAALVDREFSDGQPRLAPGHQVIEMGLAKLFRQTSDARYLNLAKIFIEARGYNGQPYSQDHKPAVQQSEAVGHAVRANYLYSGMADVAALTGDRQYFDAISRIWENVASRKLHLTGGCGARADGEAYGDDYELPNRCYNETCAAVAYLFWNHRMFLMTGHAKYMDVFERSLYNGVLSGVSLSGDRFFYPNPLEYDGKSVNNHGHAGRAPWFGCACCPPNVLRTIASLGGYVCAVKDDALFINLYAQSEATAKVAGQKVTLKQTTQYPRDGQVKIHVAPEQATRFALCLRIPSWVSGKPLPSDLYTYDDASPAPWTLMLNGQPIKFEIVDGYARLDRSWQAGDELVLDLPMPIRRVAGNPKIAATRNQVALERGPIVFALEGHDNDGSVFDAVLPASAVLKAEYRADLLGGTTVLLAENALKAERADTGNVANQKRALTAIPYALWANRGTSPMTVWLAREASAARPRPRPTLTSQARITTSFHRGGMDPARLNDQEVPGEIDPNPPNFDFWPHKGTAEWVAYEFEKPTIVRTATVSWFDDTGSGECRLPTSWKLSFRNASGEWEPVQNATAFSIRKSTPVTVRFDPVTTSALRLEVQLPPNFSSGIYEWAVE